MAVDFPVEFGPEVLTEPTKSLKEMSEEEYEAYSRNNAILNNLRQGKVTTEWKRREKIRNVRQDFRAAVNKGTKSGSEKIAQKKFWAVVWNMGGSPATTSLSFGIDADLLGTDKSLEMEVESPEGIYFSLAFLHFLNLEEHKIDKIEPLPLPCWGLAFSS